MARLVGSAKAAKAASSPFMSYSLYKQILIVKLFLGALGPIVKTSAGPAAKVLNVSKGGSQPIDL